ncbi:MAG: acyl-CoA thioesterase [Caulobacter sp.]|nr:acyl-CoA thioesterase [Caulobacter sp.]
MSRLLEPPEGRQVFTRTFTPVDSDIDANGHVNNVVYLGWVQDIAIAHWDSRAPAEEQGNWAWVVVRHEIDYRRALMPGETATGRTWVGQRRGPRFDRYVRIDGPGGEMCAQTRSEWVLVDAATRRPARVPAWMEEMFS